MSNYATSNIVIGVSQPSKNLKYWQYGIILPINTTKYWDLIQMHSYMLQNIYGHMIDRISQKYSILILFSFCSFLNVWNKHNCELHVDIFALFLEIQNKCLIYFSSKLN